MAVRSCNYSSCEYSVAYEVLHLSAETTILFLHGWGSNKELMRQAFGKLLPDFRHLYLDLPGFGRSPNDHFLSTADYASIVRAFLQELEIAPSIIIGHSFGGKVATLLNPDCLVLLSSAGILIPKPLSVRMKITLFKMFKPLGFGKLRSFFTSTDVQGMNPGMYETFKATVNEEFEENFSKVHGKALLFWGKEDTATPLWTGEQIARLIPNADFYLMAGDHYFFLNPTNAKAIVETIKKQYTKKATSEGGF